MHSGNEPKTLTRRERKVWELIAQGLSNKEIANALGNGEGTIKIHVSALMRKTNTNNRVKLALHYHGALEENHG